MCLVLIFLNTIVETIYPEPWNYSFVSISCSKSPVQSSQNLKHKFLYWKWPLPPLELFQIFIWFGPTNRPSASFSFHHLFWYFVSYQCTNSDKKPEQDNGEKKFLLVIWCSASCVYPNFSWSYFGAFIRALSSLSRIFLTKSEHLKAIYMFIRCIFLEIMKHPLHFWTSTEC